MGQVCSGEKAESQKASAFEAVDDSLAKSTEVILEESAPSTLATPALEIDSPAEDAEHLKKQREEQARLDLIVSTAGRGMVAVQSTRGSTGYYDQGFAAALAQHLDQTTQLRIRGIRVDKAYHCRRPIIESQNLIWTTLLPNRLFKWTVLKHRIIGEFTESNP